MSTHNLCFVQKYEKYLSFLSENFQFLEIQFSIYLNRHVFVMSLQWVNPNTAPATYNCSVRIQWVNAENIQ